MPPRTKSAPARATKTRSLTAEVDGALSSLKRQGTKRAREGLARYGISTSDEVFGVSMGAIQALAKTLGRNHELAGALWDSKNYEGRMLAVFVDEPARVTSAQMDRWAKDFDNWATCDTACFHLFDRTPYAFGKVAKWSTRRDEFVKRAAFALLASLALHDKKADDASFAECLPLIERAATDERNFVKKGVSWALRLVGRRSLALNKASVAVARRLSESTDAPARWIGKDALKELTSPAVIRKLETKAERAR